MISVMVIAADASRAESVYNGLRSSGKVMVARVYRSYPPAEDVTRLLAGTCPDVILLDLRDEEAARNLLARIRQAEAPAAIVGFGREVRDPEELCEAGMVRMIPGVPAADVLELGITLALHRMRGSVLENVLAFLPAKAGSGSSTVVYNQAISAAAALGKRVLVLEGDLVSGVLSVMVRDAQAKSLQSWLRSGAVLDDSTWIGMPARRHGVDWLLSDRTSVKPLPSWSQYFTVLEFAKTRYDVILVDLPERVNDATAEFVRRARQVLLVCTQEILALRLAQIRLQDIENVGARDRTRLLVNRWHPKGTPSQDVELQVGCPVAAVVPNDYVAIQRSIVEGGVALPGERLGTAFVQLAGLLAAGCAHATG